MTTVDSSSQRQAAAITRASRSNLALAFFSLPPERRQAITLFYAFCRIVDDIADEPGLPVEEKQAQLDRWSAALTVPVEGEDDLAPAVRQLIADYRIDPGLMREIIRGCAMDLRPVRYATFDDLLGYCYRVASAVGLVSIEIFGATHEGSRRYAVELGYALQLTNIIRDVAKDLANGDRIYLPQEDLQRFEITGDDLRLRKGGPRFEEMMAFQADRAEEYYLRAIAALPPEDRQVMTPAEIMRNIYHELLETLREDHFRVFDRFHRLSRWRKGWIILKVLLFGR